jgi:hypothetical protein
MVWHGEEWVDDPIEDALSDMREGHHGKGGRELATYVEQLRSVVNAARLYTDTLKEPFGGGAIPELEDLERALAELKQTQSSPG